METMMIGLGMSAGMLVFAGVLNRSDHWVARYRELRQARRNRAR